MSFEGNCLGPSCGKCLPEGIPKTTTESLFELILSDLKNRDCPYGAIPEVGEEIPVEDLAKKLRWEYPFLLAGNGGITFSGGEPLLQAKELQKLSSLLKRDGVDLTVETALYFRNNIESVKIIFNQADHVFVDIKILDEAMSLKILGQSSESFIKNMKSLYSLLSTKLTYRFVVVPGITDTIVNLRAISDFIGSFPALELQLLPVHNLGSSKYKRLGRGYPSFETPPVARLEKIALLLRQRGANVTIQDL